MAMVADIKDPRRIEPAFLLDERAMLEGWLEFHRMTLLFKCEGLTDAQRKARPVGTSLMSLHGLVRHMAEVERQWFRRVVAQDDAPLVLDYTTDEDADFAVEEADWEADLSWWQSEITAAREAVARLPLDHTGVRRGEDVSLRWAYNHMIEEYARHNGHADLIRELVEGSVGW
ncbi:MAG TPA: DinB family protein [Mycobacteriales bacterium]|nr:DinB family protein [Mycobacteriales bacterium]